MSKPRSASLEYLQAFFNFYVPDIKVSYISVVSALRLLHAVLSTCSNLISSSALLETTTTMTLSQDLALIRKNRSLGLPLPVGTAPYTCSDFYKSKVHRGKKKALSWDHRLSTESQNLQPSPLKAASRGGTQKELISLGTGRPSPEYFPWESVTFQCLQDAAAPAPGRSDENSTISMKASKGESAFDLAVAMNYGYSAGSPQALRFVTEHVELVHNPPYEDWECCLSCGTTSAVDIAFRILCNPGDTILVEKYSYSGAMASAKVQGLRTLGIGMDDLGLVPEDLDGNLENWALADGKKPFVLYMIPTGQNPTGTRQSLQRRKAIYDIAERHDLYILEDDPYYFLQLDHAASESTNKQRNGVDTTEEYTNSLPASYLSMDTFGRVLRMDTTSKILAPGLRCGWVAGCAQIIEKFVQYSEVGVCAPVDRRRSWYINYWTKPGVTRASSAGWGHCQHNMAAAVTTWWKHASAIYHQMFAGGRCQRRECFCGSKSTLRIFRTRKGASPDQAVWILRTESTREPMTMVSSLAKEAGSIPMLTQQMKFTSV